MEKFDKTKQLIEQYKQFDKKVEEINLEIKRLDLSIERVDEEVESIKTEEYAEEIKAEYAKRKDKLNNEKQNKQKEIAKTEKEKKYFRTDKNLKTITMEIMDIDKEIRDQERKLKENQLKIQEFSSEAQHEDPLGWMELYKENDEIQKTIASLKSMKEEYQAFLDELKSIELTPDEYKEMFEMERSNEPMEETEVVEPEVEVEQQEEPEVVEPEEEEIVEPAETEETKTEPYKPEEAKAEPAKPEEVKTEPVKPEPAKTEPAKPEQPKAEPVKTEQTAEDKAVEEQKEELIEIMVNLDGVSVNDKIHPYGNGDSYSFGISNEFEDKLEELRDNLLEKGFDEDEIETLLEQGDPTIVSKILNYEQDCATQLTQYCKVIRGEEDANMKITYDLKDVSWFRRLFLGKDRLNGDQIRELKDQAYNARGYANIEAGPITKLQFKIREMIEKSSQKRLAAKAEKEAEEVVTKEVEEEKVQEPKSWELTEEQLAAANERNGEEISNSEVEQSQESER